MRNGDTALTSNASEALLAPGRVIAPEPLTIRAG